MLKVGPFGFSKGGSVEFGMYNSGEIAIQLFNALHECEATATVSLVPYGAAFPPDERGVYIKDWSENEGIAKALEDAGIITLTKVVVPAGYCEAKYAILTDKAWIEYQEQLNRALSR